MSAGGADSVDNDYTITRDVFDCAAFDFFDLVLRFNQYIMHTTFIIIYKFCICGPRKHDCVLDRLDFGDLLAFA